MMLDKVAKVEVKKKRFCLNSISDVISSHFPSPAAYKFLSLNNFAKAEIWKSGEMNLWLVPINRITSNFMSSRTNHCQCLSQT